MILDRFRVTDQVAIVTGAGRGIGAASAIALAEAGADVVISARTTEQLAEVAAQIEALGRKAHVVAADLNDEAAIRNLAAAAKETFGRIDIVVNNVGGTMPRAYLDTSVGFLERAFHWNVSTAHALTTSAVPIMLENGGGSVINIASVVGKVAGRGYLGYGTAKGALIHYTELAAQDLAPKVRMNAIAVGSTLTSALDMVAADDGMRIGIENLTPLRRLGTTDDIAAAVLYLASPAGAYLTGAVLDVHGGLQKPNMDLPIPDL
ncbi:MAG TPA: SDR family oxidoreductase [Jatrophihabitantaceae bacterium]|jgi:7-alpha-hydroxysteroid dehydrogenase|nr:SDR family oxidoreductase [Jatrophihabitantaceae bacterium]